MSEVTTTKQDVQTSVTLRRITATAVMAALTTLMTAYIFHIPVGVNGGYVHLGDTMIYIAAAFLPLPYACAAGAIGGGLADLLTAPVWAPATIIIKMLICLPFSSKGKKLVTKRNVIALFLAFMISATGYYVAEGIMFGFTASFFTSVSGSIVQSGGSAVMFLIIGAALDRVGFKTKIANVGK
ncbi:TIGR04002 family protein [Blautia sp. MSJ-9]|uniref:TIGR04002 family protein n=1 Tax=Blautia sp. MSJ-9 TaxID=2841511 RepID=UPI001C0FC8DA|nr:TIGR04002 family protein [Blautia sp. MSJ-9]MBU5680934.1 TIGR04002 family protein [Blautia sp. MSJ-9]